MPVGAGIHPRMSTTLRIKHFFGGSRQYAVAGASNNPAKFGYKILQWYIDHGLSAVPVNPREAEILGQPAVASVAELLVALAAKSDVGPYQLSAADGLSVSFLTPPHATAATLHEIAAVPNYKQLVKGLWLQPGSYDQHVLDVAEALGLTPIHEDECILVRGELGMHAANL